MLRLTTRDVITIAAFVALAALAIVIALIGDARAALVGVLSLLAVLGVVARLEFAARRVDVRARRQEEQMLRDAVSDIRREVGDVHRDIRHVRAALGDISNLVGDVRNEIVDTRGKVTGVRGAIDDVRRLVSDDSTTQESIKHAAELDTKLGRVSASLTRLSTQIRYQGLHALNDSQGLAQLLAQYTPTVPLPVMSGWAFGPTGLVYVMDLITRKDVQVAIECGSGTSTLWMALAMRNKGSGKVIALEHSPEYAHRTRTVLEVHGLSEWAEVKVCPLVPTQTPRGEFQWYDISGADLPEEFDLLLVDGPPGTTGPHARYPAGPQLATRLKSGGLIIADDTDRHEEREIVAFWIEEALAETQLAAPDRGVTVLSSPRK